MGNLVSEQDNDLWGRGSRQWLRTLWAYVRKGRTKGHDLHALLRSRAAVHWAVLESEVWKPLMLRARERDAYRWGLGMIDWRCAFLAIVAETAYCWALDIEKEPERPRALREAASELRQLDRKISDLSLKMAEALDRRRELCEQFSISAEWCGPGIDLWDLLEELARMPEYCDTVGDSEAGLDVFLHYMRGTSRPTPELNDLLHLVPTSIPGKPYADFEDDVEILRKTQGSGAGSWPERVRGFLASLDEQRWQDRHGQNVTALDCFTSEMLSSLLNVMAGFDPHDGGAAALSVATIGRALRRFRSASR